MKDLLQKTHLRALMLVVLMLCGVGTTWGETVTYVFTTKDWNAKVNEVEANWTSGKAGTGFSNNGIQVTSNISSTGANGTSPVSYENISKIVVTYNTNKSAGAGSIVAQIGENASTTNNVEYTSGDGRSANYTTEFTYTKPQTGNIKLIVNTTTNSIYLVSAEITYTPSVPDTRTDVNMTSFTAGETTLIKGNTTSTSVSNDQPGWAAAYTYSSSNTSVATINEYGVITAESKGTATITAALNIASTDENFKVGENASKTLEITVNNPSHTATFSINGTTSTADFEEGTAISFPADPSDIEGKTFIGWTTEAVTGTTDEAPTLVNNTIMGTADVTYYAVFATQEVEASTTTATLTETEVQTNFTAASHKYTDGEVSYNDTEDGINWASSYLVDRSSRPWIQIKKDATAYLKINSANNISEIKLTITSAQNSSGGIEDITRHTAYTGTVYLESTVSNNPEGALGSSNVITNNVLTLIPTSNVKDLYIQVSTGARIWGAEVTYGTPATYSGYCTTVLPPVELATPIIFHDGGEYEGALKVAMAGQGTIKYSLNGGAEQTYSAPINVSETTTITAWTESNGVKSDEVSKTFTIAAATAGPAVEDKYYTIKNNGNNKYVNVAGRKTVTFVDETATAAGTVIRVKANDKGQVQILRSQGVDIPGYAEKAMNYVPKIVELIVDKLHAEGSGELLGENGLDAIMAKFKESFDYHLYLEEANGGYRIYGRTPSMQPVVDFYAENKANVDAKLPGLEAFINSAIEKVLQKTNGSGASILVPFSLQTVWEKMGSTLTKPEDEASTAKFYEEVLSSEANVWNFAYETAMIYWTKLKNHDKFKENLNKLGDYAKYIDKVENIRPNFKYYIVQKNDQLDFISQGNSELNASFTTWTLAERTDFSVAFNEDNLLNGKFYTTLYTDFAYTLPEGVKAYKVTDIEESGCFGYAVTEEVGSQNIAAQTPVLLMSESAETQALTLSESGTAVTDNLLVGPDYLINTYKITAAQVESLFDMAKAFLGEDGYNNYLKEYEHLMLRTAGTVNNKYFYGLSKDDCKNLDENVCLLGNSEEAGIGFANDWQTMNINQAFLVSDIYTAIRLSKVGDVNRDGLITIADVPALVNIILEKVKYPDDAENYDFGAADVNCDGNITITDVTSLVNIILNQ